MFGVVTKILLMYVVRASSNCTVLEWNVGIYGFFSKDATHFGKDNGFFASIRAIAFFDLDFQSTWNSTLQASWGPSFFVRSTNMNPCLRFRPIIIDAADDMKTEYMKAQVNSFWTFNSIDIDVLAYTSEVPEENVLHSGVLGKVSVGSMTQEILGNKQMFPYFFRYAISVGYDSRAAYAYYVKFGWRSLSYIRDGSRNGDAKFEVFFGLWIANNHSQSALNLHTVPSSSLPYKTTSTDAMIKTIRDGTTRLIVFTMEAGWEFSADPHCAPLPLSLCFFRDMKTMGVRSPVFQFLLVGAVEAFEKVASFNAITLLQDSLHFTRGFAFDFDAVTWPLCANFMMQLLLRMKPSYYADAYTRYGIYEWSHDTWKSYWEERVLQGTALTGMWAPLSVFRSMLRVSDMLTFILFAVNDIMTTHQPASKSQVTAKMIADAISTSRPTFTIFGGSVPFTMPYPAQEVVSIANVWQREFPSPGSNTVPPPSPICCNGSYYRSHIFVRNDSTPRWATNESSPYPPPPLLNCTPGQLKNPNGVCEWCAPGRFADRVDQTECDWCSRGRSALEKSAACEDCAAGRFGNELQMTGCIDCMPGTYTSNQGESQCTSCDFGEYSDAAGATVCSRCGGDLTTESKASLIRGACVCPIGHFSREFQPPNSSDGKVTLCEKCMQGLDCESDWPRSWNAHGSVISKTLPGFYTQVSKPYDTYKCCAGSACNEDCPGGPPESCSPDRTGLVCDNCMADGYYISAGTCRQCPFLWKLLMVWGVIGTSLVCFVVYYSSNGQLSVDADNPLAVVLFAGLVVTSAQIFGVVKDLEVPWPQSLNGVMSGSAAVFTLDMSAFPTECAVGNWSVALYMTQVLVPYLLLLEIAGMFAISKLIAKFLRKPSLSWQADKALNLAGQMMQLLFIAFCGIIMKPWQCFRHPNGRQSLKMYPRVICHENGDHSSLLALGVCTCLAFLLPFVSWCVWGCLKAPHESSNANSGFLRRFRFLLYRFRPDCWWWGLSFLLRQTLLAFATVLMSEYPHGQLFYIGAVLAVYGFLVCRWWPWISGELSFVDAAAMLVLVLMMLTASQFLPEPAPNKGRFGILIAHFFAMGALFSRFVFLVIQSVLTNGVFGEFGNGTPDRLETSKELLLWLESMQAVPNVDVIETICKMNGFDRESIIKLMCSWSAVTRRGLAGKQKRLSGLSSRIRVSKERTSQLSRQSSRLSSHTLGEESVNIASHGDSINLGQESVEIAPKASFVAGHVEKDSEMCTI